MFTTVLLAAHGATYLRLKTIGPVHERSERLARRLWTAASVLFAVVSLETWIVRPELYRGDGRRPLAWLAIAVVVAGAWALWTGLRGSRGGPRLCGIVRGHRGSPGRRRGQRLSGDAPLDAAPEYSLTAYNGAAAAHGLALALIWWPVALALAVAYFIVIMRSIAAKCGREDTQGYS